MGFSKGGDIAARVVFFSEIALNLISVVLMMKPQSFFAQFVPPSMAGEVPKLFGAGAEAFLYWYVVVLCVLSYGEARALIGFNNHALAILLEALMLGDFLHVAAAWALAQAVGGWTPSNIAGVVIALFLAAWRIFWLAMWYSSGKGGVQGKGSSWKYD